MSLLFEKDFKDYNPSWKIVTRPSANYPVMPSYQALKKFCIIIAFGPLPFPTKHDITIIDYCPIFDNGAGLLSDTTMDYPIDEDIYKLIDSVSGKTISSDFYEQ